MLCHSKVRTNLKKLDEIDTVKPSEGGIPYLSYKGMRLVVDDRLIRDGDTSGKIYPVYIAAPNTVIYNTATQSTDGTTSSSLAYDSDVPNLRKALYDRVVQVCHVNGVVWRPDLATGGSIVSAIAKCGPTNTQLATAGVWKTAYTNVKETRILMAEVNG